MHRTIAAAFVFAAATLAVPAHAADDTAALPLASAAVASVAGVRSAAAGAEIDWSSAPVAAGTDRTSRGLLLPSMYVSLAGLNAFDAYSTRAAISSGASEANPIMRSAAQNSTAMWAVKSGATATTIILADRLWRQNRKAQAIAVMVVSNGLMAAVAARNARVLTQVR
jgi:Domain of unknown function (DUF5658)